MNTFRDKISFIRKEAKRNNMTFKIDSSKLINNRTAYKFIDRVTKITLIDNCTLDSAYMIAHNRLTEQI